MNAQEAFETLVKKATEELPKVEQEGATFFARGDMVNVHKAVDRADKIQNLISTLKMLHRQWEQLFQDPSMAVNSPLFDDHGFRTPRGQQTPQEYYRYPILIALEEMDGKGPVTSALGRVEDLMSDIFSDYDRERLPNDEGIRWHKTALLEHVDMINEGFLTVQSTGNTWEIGEEGRKFLQRQANSRKTKRLRR